MTPDTGSYCAAGPAPLAPLDCTGRGRGGRGDGAGRAGPGLHPPLWLGHSWGVSLFLLNMGLAAETNPNPSPQPRTRPRSRALSWKQLEPRSYYQSRADQTECNVQRPPRWCRAGGGWGVCVCVCLSCLPPGSPQAGMFQPVSISTKRAPGPEALEGKDGSSTLPSGNLGKHRPAVGGRRCEGRPQAR